MPWFYRREKAALVPAAQPHIAGSLPRRVLLMPLGQQFVFPFQIVAAAARRMQYNPVKARGEDLLALASIPVDHAKAVQDTGELVINSAPLPVFLPVVEQ